MRTTYITIPEVCLDTRLSYGQVQRLGFQGVLALRREGKRWLVEAESVEEYKREHAR
jgi:hypothetical protein